YGARWALRVRRCAAFACTRTMTGGEDPERWFRFEGEHEGPLGELDVVLMRKDPPFDLEYIYTTYILERAEEAGALVVNRAQSLRRLNEEAYTAWFPAFTPPPLITRSMDEIR